MKPKILINQEVLLPLISSEFDIVYSMSNDVDLGICIDIPLDETDINSLICLNKKVIGTKRLTKIQQYILLKNFNINTPKTFYNEQTLNPLHSVDLFNCYIDLEEIVIKPNEGARGIGVKKILSKDYLDCLYSDKFTLFTEDKLLESNEKNYDMDAKSYIEQSFRYSSFLFQEVIDVKREFRLIIFKNNGYVIYERLKKEGQFLGNLSEGSEAIKVSLEDCKKYIQPLIEKFYPLMDKMNYPWLSIDVYIDKKDDVGVFEFQMEFAYRGFDAKIIKNLLIQTVKQYL